MTQMGRMSTIVCIPQSPLWKQPSIVIVGWLWFPSKGNPPSIFLLILFGTYFKFLVRFCSFLVQVFNIALRTHKRFSRLVLLKLWKCANHSPNFQQIEFHSQNLWISSNNTLHASHKPRVIKFIINCFKTTPLEVKSFLFALSMFKFRFYLCDYTKLSRSSQNL